MRALLVFLDEQTRLRILADVSRSFLMKEFLLLVTWPQAHGAEGAKLSQFLNLRTIFVLSRSLSHTLINYSVASRPEFGFVPAYRVWVAIHEQWILSHSSTIPSEDAARDALPSLSNRGERENWKKKKKIQCEFLLNWFISIAMGKNLLEREIYFLIKKLVLDSHRFISDKTAWITISLRPASSKR